MQAWSSDINGAEKLKENHPLCCQPWLLYPAEAAQSGRTLFTFPIPSLFFLSFLLLPVGQDEITLFLSLLPRDVRSFPGCHSRGKGWTVTLK